MANRIRCACHSCTIRNLMGPAVVITLGLLFLLSEMRGAYFDFSNTWPVLLLVIGAILLASALAPRNGHVSGSVPPAVTPGIQGPAAGTQQNQIPRQGQ